ncbi:SMI1/KNR4 family protein [Bacillus rhizoplanae]|uniref:SMI1/KNR4 family protein n=1 Tax=Bacillus rhizoplanae TaxID=2880966 RepID=UPI003D226FB1
MVLPKHFKRNVPANEEELRYLRSKFSTELPTSLKIFLRKSNGGEFCFIDSNGEKREERVFDIKRMTSGYNVSPDDRFKNLIPFYAPGNGDFYCLDVHSFDKLDECSVVYWSHVILRY